MSENLIYMEYLGSQHVFVSDSEIVKCIEEKSDLTDIYLPGKFKGSLLNPPQTDLESKHLAICSLIGQHQLDGPP